MESQRFNLSKEHSEYTKKHDEKFEKSSFSTKCIHVGAEPDFVNGSVNAPINMSTTYAQFEPGVPFGPYDYSRCGNPTRSNLERLISGIENGKYSLVWSSGMAATTGITQLLKSGEELISIDDVYGGTQRFFRKISAPNNGIKFTFVGMDSLETLQKSLNPNTRMIWVETCTNPTLKVPDIQALVKIVKSYDESIIIAVDNTFLSPYNCKPLDLGADIVVESATKYLGGHSDVVMGICSTNSKEIYDRLYFIHKSIGAVSSPFDSYLCMRGIKTLSLRMERHNSNAMQIAKFLEKHENVSKVIYPGLESSNYHEIAKKQQKGFGSVVSFIIKGGIEECKRFFANLSVFTLAESLGSVESLAEHPALMTHMSVPPEFREELGITDGFIRLHVGLEDVEDLLADLEKALNSV